ncbi:MAG: CHAT domain-containing protein [Saprospiraceae bacterium]
MPAFFYTNGYYEEGIDYLKQLDQEAGLILGDNYKQKIEIDYQIARGYYFAKRYNESIYYIEQNLEKLGKRSLEERELEEANHYNLLGVNFVAQNAPEKAINCYEKVMAIRKKRLGENDNSVASVLNNFGEAYYYLGLYGKALSYYNQSLTIRENILGKDHPTIANILINTGVLYDKKGEYNQAIRCFDRAFAIFHTNPKNFEVRIATILSNLAVTYKNKGAYQESHSYHQQAIQQYQASPNNYSTEIANVYANWSNLAVLQKNYALSIQQQQEALALYQKTLKPNHPRVVACANNLGVAYADNKEYNKALTQLQSIVPLIENDTAQREQYANLNNDLADVYFKLNNLPEAKNYNQKALAIQQELFGHKSYKLAYTYNSLAKIAEAEGNRDAALQYVQNALAANHVDFQADEIGAAPSPNGFFKYDYFVESLMHKARLLRQFSLGGLGGSGEQTALLQAKYLYEVADSALTLVRNELLASEDKIRLSEQFHALSQNAIETCVQLAEATGDRRYLEEAFQFSEESKNNVLAQSIAANQAKQFAGIPDSLITLEDQLQSDINFYKLQLAEQPDSLERVLYQNELFTAQQAYRQLITQLEKSYPFYYQLKYEKAVPRVRALQFALPEATAMVSYFIGDSILYSFVITKKDFTVHCSPITKKFYTDQQVGLRKSITLQLNDTYIVLAQELHKILFPFTLDKNIRSLVLIPDGTLNKLPFEALLSKKVNPGTTIDFTQLPYLVNDYAINYALSATLYHQELTTTSSLSRRGEGLLAYAPVFAEPQEVGYFANGVRNPLAIKDESTSRMMTFDGKFVSALPGTADEVSAITEVFKQKKQKVQSFLFKEANEQKLKKSNLGQSRYLHIATHGFVNEDQPDLSGLLFFPDSTAQEDHILYSGEVYNMRLNADLVVLSACETGLGKVASGEGLLGLSRAFFYAGANNLLVSLWKVQDQATADLMVNFYRQHLNSNTRRFTEPLRQAKLQLIRSEAFSHPYYWSAFVLIE